MENLIVDKYGGSSITCREDTDRIGRITKEDERRKIIVVSAPGISPSNKADKSYKKITDLAILYSKTRNPEIIGAMVQIYHRIYPDVSLNEFQSRIGELTQEDLSGKAFEDFFKARAGEALNAEYLAKTLNAEYIDAAELFSVSGDFGQARILPESEDKIRKKLKNIERLTIIPGFYGKTIEGKIATFKRGGSDLTGAYIAASLNADLYENFTDTSVLTADPNIVSPIIPATISELTFDELRDLSYFGFGIFNSESIEPLQREGVLTHIRNTFEYPNEGTFVVNDRICDRKKPIVGIAYQNGFVSFDLRKTGLNDITGIGMDILKVFRDRKVPYEITPGAVDNISIIVNKTGLGKHDVHYILRDLGNLLGNSKIDFLDNLGMLVVAGKAFRGNRGIAADILSTLAKADVNIRAISQGSDERCIMYGIEDDDRKKAMTSLFERYDYLRGD
ncbi:MAG: hypothetical protein Q7R52_05300 [archaeon]|nr:hypothetical protein [archaeon]